MGIQGLQMFINEHNKRCLKAHKLHDCVVFVDGNNLAYKLYAKTPDISSAFGGEYDKYAAHVTFFFMRLHQCNIHPIVLMDGGQPPNNIKVHTSASRLQANINSCLSFNPAAVHARIFPLNGRSVFISVLKRLGVLVLQCDFEADEDLAFLAKKFNAKVISNDSDFYLHDVQFVPLDSLKYFGTTSVTSKDGVEKKALSCNVFLRDSFLVSLNIRPHRAALLATLCGNDCVPQAYLKEFHTYVIGGCKKRVGYNKRQNSFRLIGDFISGHKTLADHQIVDLVSHRVSEDIRDTVKSLLLKVLSSYKPKSSKLTFWVKQHLDQVLPPSNPQNPSMVSGVEDPEVSGIEDPEVSGVEDPKVSGVEDPEVSGVEDPKVSGVEDPEVFEDPEVSVATDANNSSIRSDTDVMLQCQGLSFKSSCGCEQMWKGVVENIVDDKLLKDISDREQQEVEKLGDEEEESFLDDQQNAYEEPDNEPDDHDYLTTSVEDAYAENCIHLTNNESRESDSEIHQESGMTNKNKKAIRADNNNDGDTGLDITSAENGATEEEIMGSNQSVDGSSEATPEEVDFEGMSKKQKKKYLAQVKQIERMRKKLQKKKEQVKKEKLIHRSHQQEQRLNVAGLDANQLVKLVDDMQNIKKRQFSFSEDTEEELPEMKATETFSERLFQKKKATETFSSQREDEYISCAHSESYLVTKTGFRLPDWLVYGYRHALVTREISDMVTNDFCISPAQLEIRDKESCYRSVEEVVKSVLTMVKGEGWSRKWSSQKVVKSEKVGKSVLTMVKGEGTENGTIHEELNVPHEVHEDSAKLSKNVSLNSYKRRKSKLLNNFIWYIREKSSLLPQDYNLNDIFSECKATPSLKFLATLSVSDRKKLFLDLLFDSNAEFLGLPEQVQLPMIFICYWFKNCKSDVDSSHLMSLILTFMMFYFIDGQVGRKRSSSEEPCVHCSLQEEKAYEQENRIGSLVNNMSCYRSKFNSKKQKKRKRAKGRTFEVEAEVCQNDEKLSEVCKICLDSLEMDPSDSKILGSMDPSDSKILDSMDPSDSKILDSMDPSDLKILDSMDPSDLKILDSMDPSDSKILEMDLDSSYLVHSSYLAHSKYLAHLVSSVSKAECLQASDRLSSYHIHRSLDNSNYNREFVHAMSEFQAVVHYLNLLNGVMLAPFPPIYMERIWSGTFCYNANDVILSYGDRNLYLVALLLGPKTHLYKLFKNLHTFACNISGIVAPKVDDEKKTESMLIEMFLKGAVVQKKKVKKQRKQKKLMQVVEDDFGMDVDDGCENVTTNRDL